MSLCVEFWPGARGNIVFVFLAPKTEQGGTAAVARTDARPVVDDTP
jgi:hypothetical protein